MRSLLVASALLPLSALACDGGEAHVFSCRTDTTKDVSVCQGASVITYRYGKPGQKPELTISEKNDSFVWEHGEGVSSGIGDLLIFNNGPIEYSIMHTANFNDPTDTMAHLTVSRPGKEHVYIECTSGIKLDAARIKARPRELTEGTPTF